MRASSGKASLGLLGAVPLRIQKLVGAMSGGTARCSPHSYQLYSSLCCSARASPGSVHSECIARQNQWWLGQGLCPAARLIAFPGFAASSRWPPLSRLKRTRLSSPASAPAEAAAEPAWISVSATAAVVSVAMAAAAVVAAVSVVAVAVAAAAAVSVAAVAVAVAAVGAAPILPESYSFRYRCPR